MRDLRPNEPVQATAAPLVVAIVMGDLVVMVTLVCQARASVPDLLR